MSDRQARLIERGHNFRNGGTYETWDIGDGDGIYVDFNPCPFDTMMPETMAFPYDPRRNKVTSWDELGVWLGDMTGGEAMQELGYDPVEEACGGDDCGR